MRKQDFLSLKELEIPALKKKAIDAKKDINKLLMDKNMNKLKDLKSITKKRKDLSQILTVMRQKELLEKGDKNANR